MSKENNLRVCRVIPTHPSNLTPGAGLPAYYLSYYITVPTLHIICKQPPGSILRTLPEHVDLRQVSYAEISVGNSAGIKRITLASLKMLSYLVFCIKSIPAMVRFKPTVVHTHTAIPLFHGLFGKYFLGARWVLTLHGSDFLEVKRNRFLQTILRRMDKLCYVSENMREELSRIFPDIPLHHTPSGVNLDLFVDSGLQRQPQIIMVGRLSWQKGYSYALQGFKRFLDTYPDWQLVILGEGDERPGIEQQILDLHLQNKVLLMGSCPQKTVAETLQQSTIFLLTSTTEGFPKVLLEASACGTPVVAANVGDCHEISDHAGITIPPKDIDAIATALTRLASDTNFWNECSQKGKQLVEKYKWEQMARLVVQTYE